MSRIVVGVTAAPAARLIEGQVRSLSGRGHDVHVVVGEDPGVRFDGVTLHVVPMHRDPSPVADLRSLRAWTALLRRLRPDVVIGATPKAGLLSLAAARLARTPIRIWWVWGLRSEGDVSTTVRRVEMTTGRFATGIIAASTSLATLLRTWDPTLDPVVLGEGGIVGVRLERFKPAATASEPVIVYAGRLARDKGIGDLAAVWPLVVDRVPDARLLLVGAVDPLDPPGADLDRLCAMPGVQELGYRSDIEQVMSSGRALVLPSQREGLPGVVLEAAACELPTVAWDATGTRDAVLDGVTGYLVPKGDIALMADRIVDLLEDESTATSLGQKARVRTERSFAADVVERQLADYVERTEKAAR